jgi:7-cyano-7-deazaguanine reductase
MPKKVTKQTIKYGLKEIAHYADPKNWELWDAPKKPQAIYQKFPEFTCLCPRSGYPDHATVHLITVPNKKVLEMKNLKMWLNSYRNIGISHENATHEILNTLMETLNLYYGFILMEYQPRGNLTTFLMSEFENTDNVNGYIDAVDTAVDLKRNIINKIMNKYSN